MPTVPNEETSEFFVQRSPPLAPGLDSGAPVNSRLVADNQPNKTNAAGLVRGGLPPRVLRRVCDHIDANIDQRIRVEALAKLANLSVWYFVRAFKQSVGATPHDYLIRRRVERTLELLSGTELSLSEIALAAGFSDQSHCARRFRQHVGMSPREYRWLMP